MGWSCAACTYQNDNDSIDICGMCSTKRRPSSSGSTDSSNSKKKATKTTTQMTLFGTKATVETTKQQNKSTTPKTSSSLTTKTNTTNTTNRSKGNTASFKKAPSSTATTAVAAVTAKTNSKSLNNNGDSKMNDSNNDNKHIIIKSKQHNHKFPTTLVKGVFYETLWNRSQKVLNEVFGLPNLRKNLQPLAVECALRKQSQIVVLATGGGKSLCYQLPATIIGGVTMVISPLIALMIDQVQALNDKGIPSALISSSQTDKENTAVLERLLGRPLSSKNAAKKPASTTGKKQQQKLTVSDTKKDITLLYITPESIQTERFRSILKELHSKQRLAMFAVDEAHCLSSWGHDFRPAYRRLDYLRSTFPDVPCMACTATATPKVLEDIRSTLELDDAPTHIGSFDRPNIFYKVRYKDSIDASGLTTGGALQDLITNIEKQHKICEEQGQPCSGIVYVHKRNDTTMLAKAITAQTKGKIKAEGYHAGLSDKQRTKVQQDWSTGVIQVAVATVAFGMGIDLAHVRYVIHWSLAKSVEAFYQESGRAGRDGLPAHSILYYSKKDASTFAFLVRKQHESSKQPQDVSNRKLETSLRALENMVEYCTKPSCRRQFLLHHFGQEISPKECNKACDYCCDPKKVESAIQASEVIKDVLHQSKQRRRKQQDYSQPWDGQWGNAHGDGNGDNNDWGDYNYNVGDLRVTGSFREDDNDFSDSNQKPSGKGGNKFEKASSILAKYEAMECGDETGSFVKFRKKQREEPARVCTVTIPEHLRANAPDPLQHFAKEKKMEQTSEELKKDANKLQQELEKMKAEQAARLKALQEKQITTAPPPPPPPMFGGGAPKKKRRRA